MRRTNIEDNEIYSRLLLPEWESFGAKKILVRLRRLYARERAIINDALEDEVSFSDLLPVRESVRREIISLLGQFFHIERVAPLCFEAMDSASALVRAEIEKHAQYLALTSGYAKMIRQSLLTLGQNAPDETKWYLTREEAELSGELPKFGSAERVGLLRSELDELEGRYNSDPEASIALVPRMLELRACIANELGYSSFNEKQLRGLMMSHIGMSGLRRLLPSSLLAVTKKLDDRAMYEDLYTAQDILRAVFHVFQTRYGVTLTKMRASAWNENISFYAVYRGDTLVGGLYLDLFARKGKMKGSWVTTLRDGTTKPLPLVVLVSDLKKGRKNSHHQFLTVLHESGHALHHLFARPRSYLGFVRYVEEDAMEVFGRFFERYAFEEDVIRATLPAKTSEANARCIVRQIVSARSAYLIFDRRYDLAVSVFDQDIHARPKRSEEEIRRTWKKICTTYIGGKDADRLPPSLRSVFGGPHSARFVIYVWADILAAQMFHQYQMVRKRDPKKAEHMLLEMFQKGSSAPFWDIIAPLLRGRVTAKSYLAEMKRA